MTVKKKTGLTVKKRSTTPKPEAQIIIEGEAWRTTDPDLQATKQARHATSRNSGTPVTLIRSPTQRMGDALNALRP